MENITMDTKFTITEDDDTWESQESLNDLFNKGWKVNQSDLNTLSEGKIVKSESPNGKRVISIHPDN